MQISGLPSSSSFSASDVLAIEINGVTYKLTGSTLASALASLGAYATKTNGVLPAGQGGTGNTSLNASANAFINALSTGNDIPVDADYFISQFVGGGTSNTTYYRRPMSKVLDYCEAKAGINAVSTGNSTYISAVSGGYAKFGRLVVFSIAYTMRAAITNTVANAVVGLPVPVGPARFLEFDKDSTTAISSTTFCNLTTSGTINLRGAHAQGDTYYVSGAYISAS